LSLNQMDVPLTGTNSTQLSSNPKKKKRKRTSGPPQGDTAPTSNESEVTPSKTPTPTTNGSSNSNVNTSKEGNSTSNIPKPNTSPLDLALIEKKRGNLDFKKGDFSSAISRYTKAMAFSPKNTHLFVSLLTNRAITYLFLEEYVKALEDCAGAITIDSNFVKAYICSAFAYFNLQNYEKTFSSLEMCSKLQIGNKTLQQNLIKAKEALIQQQRKDETFTAPPNKMKRMKKPKFSDFFDLLDIDDEEKATIIVEGTARATQKVVAVKSASRPPPIVETEELAKKQAVAKPVSDMPLLIPVGEVLSSDCSTSSYLEPPSKQAEENALKAKEEGNRAFSDGNYLQALEYYSKAIQLNWREAVFFSNRALVYLKLNRFFESITDCTASIDRMPSIKAYARRAAAWAFLKEYFLAAEDYKKALKFESKNQDCLAELQKCLFKLEMEYRQKLDLDLNNEKLKKSVHNVREDLKRIASKIEQKEVPAKAVKTTARLVPVPKPKEPLSSSTKKSEK